MRLLAAWPGVSGAATAMAAMLEGMVDKMVQAVPNDGRNIVGLVKGFDQTTNVILDECHERGIDADLLCLMARRLVEHGVRYVEVMSGGWDTHSENFDRLEDLTPQIDQGLSALLGYDPSAVRRAGDWHWEPAAPGETPCAVDERRGDSPLDLFEVALRMLAAGLNGKPAYGR